MMTRHDANGTNGTNGTLRVPRWVLVTVPIVATLIWLGIRMGREVQQHLDDARLTRELICEMKYGAARPFYGPCRNGGGGH